MKITEEKTENVYVFYLEGRLDSTNFTTFRDKLMNQINNQQNILVDCSKLAYISSAGLGIFVQALQLTKKKHGHFMICGLNQKIIEVFEITQLTKYFSIFETKEDAVSCYST